MRGGACLPEQAHPHTRWFSRFASVRPTGNAAQLRSHTRKQQGKGGSLGPLGPGPGASTAHQQSLAFAGAGT